MTIIKKITRIKKLGIYDNFTWMPHVPEFKQCNIIYGWNGTGKTTLSKLLGALNRGGHNDFDNLEYSIIDSDAATHTQGSNFGTPIRVFNSEFIASNVDFDTQSSKAITVVLGEENKEALEAIEADEKKLDELNANIIAKTTDKKAKETLRSAKFTDIARTISQGTHGAIVRNYNKNNAEIAFNSMAGKDTLGDSELEVVSKSVAQDTMPKQSKLSLGDAEDELATIVIVAKKILKKTVESVVIARLKDNSDISDWVEKGLEIHQKHSSADCEFCGQTIDTGRLAEVTAHFNEADAKLKTDIDDLVERLKPIYVAVQAVQPIDKMNLYQEYRDVYVAKSQTAIERRDLLLEEITSFAEFIKSKKSHTTEKVELKTVPVLTELVKAINEVNDVISDHNEKTDNFDQLRKANSQKIERHYLSTIYDDIKTLDGKIAALGVELVELHDGIEGDENNIGKAKLVTRIAGNKAKISSSHKACDILNTSLQTFLGHDEISFVVNKDDTGYLIMRADKPAKSLSEGERTAIAFIFFVTQLGDEDFDRTTGIIVIDDPISSLDANSQFQAFSFLKNATVDAGQLFILTHNFDFLKLVTSWIKHSRRTFSLYMVKNKFSEIDGSRTAFIDKLDPALEKFESEYHYLFNILYAYKDDGTIENAYKMPNIARKLLDSYLMFCIPKNIGTYERLQELSFDEEKKAAIYKFVNDQSHITGAGFDPSLVPEAQKCISYLMELMEVTFPAHYQHLVETTT